MSACDRPTISLVRHWLSMSTFAAVILAVFCGYAAPGPRAQTAEDQPAKASTPETCLLLSAGGRYGRSSVPTDPLVAELVTGKWAAPSAGKEFRLPDGSVRQWELLKAARDGSYNHQGSGYAYVSVTAEKEQVVLLEAAGHSMVYVNGEPRGGDPYNYGYVRLPILLHEGTNDLLFHLGRGRLTVRWSPVNAPALFNLSDATTPDLLVDEDVDTEAAVIVCNASTQTQAGLVVQATLPRGEPQRTDVPPLIPLGTRKVGFRLRGPSAKSPGSATVRLELIRKHDDAWETVATGKLALRVLRGNETHKRTFRSNIDRSVQYYAVVPARSRMAGTRAALVLTLHGAAVEALGQAQSYAPKPDLYLVAPTNRRPYGFDWEDWGRMDALEVLELTQKQLQTDPQRTYLTGHSMGGHGVWHLGATYPDRFAAIAPSAGWISMWSYAGARRPEHPDPVQEMLLRASAPSDTLALVKNYAHHGVYVLHGDRDDNVPVAQARAMRKQLGQFHPDMAYFEEPGAGHWWGKAGISGAACVDWPPFFEFFAHRIIPSDASIHQVDFVTASPGVSAWSHWVGIEAQLHPLKPSSISLHCDRERRRFSGTTDNVARLALATNHLVPGGTVRVELDGQSLDGIPLQPRLWLTRAEGKWSITGPPSPDLKTPERNGPFKEAFRNHVLFVYGTHGTPEENAWALARARLDGETFWYRGNASVDIVPDTQFDPRAEPDRNVILYGHAESNGAWPKLLADTPVQVERGHVRAGDHEVAGEGLGCLFIRPRPGSERALVGVVAGSGLPGMRLTEQLPYFLSGTGYPDCLILGTESLLHETKGVHAVGFFGADWSIAKGEFVWSN